MTFLPWSGKKLAYLRKVKTRCAHIGRNGLNHFIDTFVFERNAIIFYFTLAATGNKLGERFLVCLKSLLLER